MQNPNQPQQPQSSIIYSTNVVQVPVPLGPESAVLTCPSCHHQIRTTVESKANTRTHLSALLLCCFLCWPCACLPYCMDSCQTQVHTCPHCKSYLGAFQN